MRYEYQCPRALSLSEEYWRWHPCPCRREAEHGVRPYLETRGHSQWGQTLLSSGPPSSLIPDVDVQGRVFGAIEIADLAVRVDATVDQPHEILALVTERVARERLARCAVSWSLGGFSIAIRLGSTEM